MYELYEVALNQYEIHSRFKGASAMRGDLKSISKYMYNHLGFPIEEIELAVTEMVKKDHDAAHFGIYRGFIFSFNRADRKTA